MDLVLLIFIIVIIVRAFKGQYNSALTKIIAIATTIWQPLAMIAYVVTHRSVPYIIFDMIISFPILIVGTHLDGMAKRIANKHDTSWWKIDWHDSK